MAVQDASQPPCQCEARRDFAMAVGRTMTAECVSTAERSGLMFQTMRGRRSQEFEA